MKKYRSLIFICILSLIFVSCMPSASSGNSIQTAIAQTQVAMPIAMPTLVPTPTLIPTPIPTKLVISEMFRTQIVKLLEEGTKLTAMTEQGVNYLNFRDQLPNVMSPWDLAVANWPKGFPDNSKEFIYKALNGWQLADSMWYGCVRDVEVVKEIYGPVIWGQYVDFEGNNLITAAYGDEQIIEDWRGMTYLPCENIGILFGISTVAFDKGKELLLKELPH